MINYISKPFRWFFKLEAASGLVLLFAAIIALFISNSGLADLYFATLNKYLFIGINNFGLKLSVLHWINDALMAIFFFFVTLEIKREFLQGELSNIKQALLPIIAAVGGMLVPALFYVFINLGDSETLNGWAIPSATDIAFSLGVLSLLGKRVPLSLKVFLTALAIIDDLGAIVIIALFYSGDLSIKYLTLMLLAFIVLLLINKFNIKKFLPYLVVGLFLWDFTHNSGIHATIAGVLLAMTIPHRKKEKDFSKILTAASGHILIEAQDGDIILKGRNVRITAEDGQGEITLVSGKHVYIKGAVTHIRGTNVNILSTNNLSLGGTFIESNGAVSNETGTGTDLTQGSFLGKIFKWLEKFKDFLGECEDSK